MQGIDNRNKRNGFDIKPQRMSSTVVNWRGKAHIKDVVLNLKNWDGLNKTYL